MHALLFALLLCSACGPGPDCVTAGGLRVFGAADCVELWPMQTRIESEVESLGYRARVLDGADLYVITEGLDAKGGFQVEGRSYAGRTICERKRIVVAYAGGEWTSTALAHESFHLAQGCVWDEAERLACKDAGPREGETATHFEYRCVTAAQHPRWDAEIYPAIAWVNTP